MRKIQLVDEIREFSVHQIIHSLVEHCEVFSFYSESDRQQLDSFEQKSDMQEVHFKRLLLVSAKQRDKCRNGRKTSWEAVGIAKVRNDCGMNQVVVEMMRSA